MTRPAHDLAGRRDRRGYQREVAELLEQIDAQRRRRGRLEAAGARRGALAALEGEAERTRGELAAVIGSLRGGRPARGVAASTGAVQRALPRRGPRIASGQRIAASPVRSGESPR